MKILTLTHLGTSEAVATIYKPKDNGASHYNLRLGTRGESLWEWSCCVSSRTFPVTEDSPPTLVLEGDNYTITPIRVKGEILRDARGNIRYTIDTDNDKTHRKDMLLLWLPGARGYRNIEYETSGDCVIIGTGSRGKVRDVVVNKLPVVVVEVYGTSELTWTGVDDRGRKYSQTHKYSCSDDKLISYDIVPVGDHDEV